MIALWYHKDMTVTDTRSRLAGLVRRMWRPTHRFGMLGVAVLFVCMLWFLPTQAQTPAGGGPVYTITVEGTLTTAAISYIHRAVQVAEAAHANALIITLTSNGGVLREIRPLAAQIVAAEVPVIVYIAPSGTQAGAPGAFLASAAHLSAMAPQTSFGSAYPLAQVDAALSPSSSALVVDSIADQLRDWNRSRNRDVAWIEQAVQTGAILTNEQAIATTPPAVNFIAADQQQLLTLLDGRVVTLASGVKVQLTTLGKQPQNIAPSLIEQIWQILAEPNTIFALLVLGALAIYLEFAAPGTSFFAGVGVVLLIAALIGLVALPVQWWAIGLILLGLALIGLEFVVTTHGGLTIAGLVLLGTGGLSLVDPLQAPGAGVAPWAVIVIVFGLSGVLVGGFVLAFRVRRRPPATGSEAIIGRVAEVRQRLDPQGMVFVDGALWQAVSEEGVIEAGDWVRITSVHRLRLMVRAVEAE